jgi:hypothetical protein
VVISGIGLAEKIKKGQHRICTKALLTTFNDTLADALRTS